LKDVETPPQISRLVVPEHIGHTKFTDTIDIDQEGHRLYMGDNWSSGIDVFDITSRIPQYLKTIRSSSMRPAVFFGLCVAKNVGRVFVAHGTSLVSVIDIEPDSATCDMVVATLSTGGRMHADLIDYDPVHKKVYVGNREEGFMTSIDAVTNHVMKRISGLGRALEQPRFNSADGMVYIVSNSDNLLHQIDPTTDELVQTFEIGDECNPNGLAINPVTNQALLACDNHERPHTIIWDLNAHRVASSIPDCGCGDGAIYDPVADRFFFAASGFPSGPVIGIFGGNPVQLRVNVPTQAGASWVAFDQTNKMVYAPAIQDGKPALISFALPDE
jgi:DNA-binding beta-propeller fold protein YncE